jgi:PAS domain S-box-containing protein
LKVKGLLRDGDARPDVPHQGKRHFRVEDRYRLLVDAVKDYAIFMLDPEGIICTWNDGAERIKGYRADEIVGRHFSIFYPAESIAMGLPARMLEAATKEGAYADEGLRVRKDGSRFWAGVVITALRGDDGTLLGFGKVTRDLTERGAAREALQASNRRECEIASELSEANAYLKNIFNASTLVAIIATNLQRTITVFNPGAERMLGYRADEIVGHHTASLFHLPEEVEERARALSTYLNRPIRGAEFFRNSVAVPGFDQLDWTYVRKDGTRLTVLLSLSLVRDEAGQPIGYLGVAEDITESRKATAKIAAVYKQLNAALECTSDCVITIGHDWTLLYANQRALEMLPDFVPGRNYWACFPLIVGTPPEKVQRDAMENRTSSSYETFYEPYGRWYKVRLYPSEEGLSIFFTDITDEKKMQEQIAMEQVLREKRIEALSHMAGGLAHEISNPLAIIHARASDLKALAEGGEPVPANEVARASDSIVHTADRAIRILRGLRGFGREAGNDAMELASIESIVDQCVELQQMRFDRHFVALCLDLHPNLPPVLCRETQIGQILTNLLNNAFDAIEQSGVAERWVTLTARPEGETVVLDVVDSGPGIEDQFRPYLMEPFFTTKTNGLGMGVGLSLSRAIAQDHGGSLSLGEQDGHTCFRIILPVDPTAVKPG